MLGFIMYIVENEFRILRLIYQNEEPTTLILEKIPPSPLHLFMGIINELTKCLEQAWEGFPAWMKANSILKHGYQG